MQWMVDVSQGSCRSPNFCLVGYLWYTAWFLACWPASGHMTICLCTNRMLTYTAFLACLRQWTDRSMPLTPSSIHDFCKCFAVERMQRYFVVNGNSMGICYDVIIWVLLAPGQELCTAFRVSFMNCMGSVEPIHLAAGKC